VDDSTERSKLIYATQTPVIALTLTAENLNIRSGLIIVCFHLTLVESALRFATS
jgi:hypothetical protein